LPGPAGFGILTTVRLAPTLERVKPCALALSALFLAAMPATGTAAPACAFGAAGNPATVRDYVSSWAGRHHLFPGDSPVEVTTRVEGGTAVLAVSSAGASLEITVRLGPGCSAVATIGTRRDASPADLPAAALDELATGLPLPREPLALPGARVGGAGARHPRPPLDLPMLSWARNPDAWSSDLLDPAHGAAIEVAFLALALVLVWRASRGAGGGTSPDGRLRAVDAAIVVAMALLAALPVLPLPFTETGPIMRAAFSARDLLGDPNHTFLPLALNAPVARLTAEPWALRVVPFLLVASEALLLAWAAGRAGGRLAGALAAAWLACEVRRRHGMPDLSDWDLASIALLAWTGWWLLREEETPRRAASLPVLGLLIAFGALSSWLLVAPAAVLASVLVLDPVVKARAGRAGIAVVAVAAALAGIAGLRVLSANLDSRPPCAAGAAIDFLGSLAARLPVGRTAWMALPLAIGLGWLALRRDRPSCRFAAGSIVAVPAALAALWTVTCIRPYYVEPVTVLLLWAAAVGTTRALASARASPLDPAPPLPPSPRATLAVAVPLVVLTVALPPRPEVMGDTGGFESVGLFDRLAAGDDLPIVTNSPELLDVVAWNRIRERGGAMADFDSDDPGRRAFQARLRVVATGADAGGIPREGPFWLVSLGLHSDVIPPAVRDLEALCAPVFPPGSLFRFYRCD
jgi:hypothetical protein